MRYIHGVAGLEPFFMEDLYLRSDVYVSCAAPFAVVLVVPPVDRHPDMYVRPSCEQGHAHARKNVRRTVLFLVAEIALSRQLQAQFLVCRTVGHVDYRQCVRTEVSRRYTRRLTQIRFPNRHFRHDGVRNKEQGVKTKYF